jgi:hypothetical protein
MMSIDFGDDFWMIWGFQFDLGAWLRCSVSSARFELALFFFFGSSKVKGASSIIVIGAGYYYWCRPIGAGWDTGTYKAGSQPAPTTLF